MEDLSPIELGYKLMSEDIEREKEAFDWIENTATIFCNLKKASFILIKK